MPRGSNPNSRANLKPQNTRTKKEQREVARKGGKESGKKRAEYKTFKECFKANMTGEMRDELFAMLMNRAKHGNLKAFEIIRDTMGELPKTENMDMQNNLQKAKEILGGIDSAIN